MKFLKNSMPTEFNQHLIHGERILTWANHAGGKLVVTNFALLSFDHHENLRLPWELTLSAKWEEPVLIVVSQAQSNGPSQTRAWQLSQPGLVPESVRERITTTQVFDQVREIKDLGKVRFLARKSATGISWATLCEVQIPQSSQTHLAQELAQLRTSLGI